MELFKNISKFGILAIIEKALAFVFIPLLSNTFGMERLGEYFIFLSTYNILLILGKFGQDAFVTVNVQKLGTLEFKEYFLQSKSYVFQRSSVSVMLLLIFGLIIDYDILTMLFLALGSLGGSLLQLELNRCHGSNQINQYFTRVILLSSIRYGVSILLLILIPFKFYWIYLLYALAPWVVLLVFRVLKLKANLLFGNTDMINRTNTLQAFAQQFSNVGLNSSVKYIVGWKLSTTALGGYGAVESFSVIMGVFSDAVYRSWLPIYFTGLKKGINGFMTKVSPFILVFLFVAVFTLFSKSILNWMYPKEEGIQSSLVLLFALYYLANFLYRINSADYYYNENIQNVYKTVLIGSLLALISLLVLINYIGITGVVVSLVLGQIVMIIGLKIYKLE